MKRRILSILHAMIMTHDSLPRIEARYTESYGERIARNDLTWWCIAITLHIDETIKSKHKTNKQLPFHNYSILFLASSTESSV